MDETNDDPTRNVSEATRRRFLRVMSDMRAEMNGGAEAKVRKTALDYEHGCPKHNAEVFIELSDWSFHGVDDEGIFCEKNSAGTFRFGVLVDMLMDTDVHKRLSVTDAEEAVAMLFHLTRSLQVDEDSD